jgi:hypothetical protein
MAEQQALHEVYNNFIRYCKDGIRYYKKELFESNERLSILTDIFNRDEEYYISNFNISFNNIRERKLLKIPHKSYIGKDKFKVLNIKIYNNLIKRYDYSLKKYEEFMKVYKYPRYNFITIYKFLIREIERIILETGKYKAGYGLGTMRLILLDHKPNYNYHILRTERKRVIDTYITHFFYPAFVLNKRKKNMRNYFFKCMDTRRHSIYGSCYVEKCPTLKEENKGLYLFYNEKDCLDNDYVNIGDKIKFLMHRDMWYFKDIAIIKK